MHKINMKCAKFLKTLYSIMQVKPNDGRRLYCRMDQALRAFLTSDEEVIDPRSRLEALSLGVSTFARLVKRYRPVRNEGDHYMHCIFLEMAKFLLGVDLYPYNEGDEIMVTFRNCMKNARRFFGDWEPGARLVAALDTLPSVHWQDPILRLILDGEDVDEEKALAYVDSAEPKELLQLRVQMMLDLRCDAQACNLIGWCIRGQRMHHEIAYLVKRFDLLTRLGNLTDFCKQSNELTCCTSYQCLEYALAAPGYASPLSILSMSRSFVLFETKNFTDPTCGKEILKEWLKLEQKNWLNKPFEFKNACHEVLVWARDGQQLVDILTTIEQLFGNAYLEPCVEAGLRAIRKERFRMFCAEHYLVDETVVRSASANIVLILDCLARLFDDHIQLKLSCHLSAFALLPTVDRMKTLEICCSGMMSWPPKSAIMPPMLNINTKDTFQQLLRAIDLLRDQRLYRPQPAGWQSLKPVLEAQLKGVYVRVEGSRSTSRVARRTKIESRSVEEGITDIKEANVADVIKSPGKRGRPRRIPLPLLNQENNSSDNRVSYCKKLKLETPLAVVEQSDCTSELGVSESAQFVSIKLEASNVDDAVADVKLDDNEMQTDKDAIATFNLHVDDSETIDIVSTVKPEIGESTADVDSAIIGSLASCNDVTALELSVKLENTVKTATTDAAIISSLDCDVKEVVLDAGGKLDSSAIQIDIYAATAGGCGDRETFMAREMNSVDDDDDADTIIEEDFEECEIASTETDLYDCNRDCKSVDGQLDGISVRSMDGQFDGVFARSLDGLLDVNTARSLDEQLDGLSAQSVDTLPAHVSVWSVDGQLNGVTVESGDGQLDVCSARSMDGQLDGISARSVGRQHDCVSASCVEQELNDSKLLPSHFSLPENESKVDIDFCDLDVASVIELDKPVSNSNIPETGASVEGEKSTDFRIDACEIEELIEHCSETEVASVPCSTAADSITAITNCVVGTLGTSADLEVSTQLRHMLSAVESPISSFGTINETLDSTLGVCTQSGTIHNETVTYETTEDVKVRLKRLLAYKRKCRQVVEPVFDSVAFGNESNVLISRDSCFDHIEQRCTPGRSVNSSMSVVLKKISASCEGSNPARPEFSPATAEAVCNVQKLRKCLVVLENVDSTEATDMSSDTDSGSDTYDSNGISQVVLDTSASFEMQSLLTRSCCVKLCRLPQPVGVPNLSECQVVLEKLALESSTSLVNTSPFHVATSCEETIFSTHLHSVCSVIADDDSTADCSEYYGMSAVCGTDVGVELGNTDSHIPDPLTVDSSVAKSVPTYDSATTDEFSETMTPVNCTGVNAMLDLAAFPIHGSLAELAKSCPVNESNGICEYPVNFLSDMKPVESSRFCEGSFPESIISETIELVSTVVEETIESKLCSAQEVAETVITGSDTVQACTGPVHQKLESIDISDDTSHVAFESELDPPQRLFETALQDAGANQVCYSSEPQQDPLVVIEFSDNIAPVVFENESCFAERRCKTLVQNESEDLETIASAVTSEFSSMEDSMRELPGNDMLIDSTAVQKASAINYLGSIVDEELTSVQKICSCPGNCICSGCIMTTESISIVSYEQDELVLLNYSGWSGDESISQVRQSARDCKIKSEGEMETGSDVNSTAGKYQHEQMTQYVELKSSQEIAESQCTKEDPMPETAESQCIELKPLQEMAESQCMRPDPMPEPVDSGKCPETFDFLCKTECHDSELHLGSESSVNVALTSVGSSPFLDNDIKSTVGGQDTDENTKTTTTDGESNLENERQVIADDATSITPSKRRLKSRAKIQKDEVNAAGVDVTDCTESIANEVLTRECDEIITGTGANQSLSSLIRDCPIVITDDENNRLNPGVSEGRRRRAPLNFGNYGEASPVCKRRPKASNSMDGKSIVNEDGEINLSSVCATRKSGIKTGKQVKHTRIDAKRQKIEPASNQCMPNEKLFVRGKTKSSSKFAASKKQQFCDSSEPSVSRRNSMVETPVINRVCAKKLATNSVVSQATKQSSGGLVPMKSRSSASKMSRKPFTSECGRVAKTPKLPQSGVNKPGRKKKIDHCESFVEKVKSSSLGCEPSTRAVVKPQVKRSRKTVSVASKLKSPQLDIISPTAVVSPSDDANVSCKSDSQNLQSTVVTAQSTCCNTVCYSPSKSTPLLCTDCKLPHTSYNELIYHIRSSHNVGKPVIIHSVLSNQVQPNADCQISVPCDPSLAKTTVVSSPPMKADSTSPHVKLAMEPVKSPSDLSISSVYNINPINRGQIARGRGRARASRRMSSYVTQSVDVARSPVCSRPPRGRRCRSSTK